MKKFIAQRGDQRLPHALDWKTNNCEAETTFLEKQMASKRNHCLRGNKFRPY